MLHFALCAALSVAAGNIESLVGQVRLTRGVVAPVVSIVVDGKNVEISGELLTEIMRLQAAKLELLGRRDGERFVPTAYRILDVGGGIKPLVGLLVETASGLGLKDGEGTPIPLSMSPRTKRRLQNRSGAKLWISGKKLASGEMKVLRYGILKDPPELSKQDPEPK